MQVGVPGKGTGAVCNSKISELIRCYSSAPHRRPNWVAVLTDEKLAALLAACPPQSSGFQTRLAMCASAFILQES